MAPGASSSRFELTHDDAVIAREVRHRLRSRAGGKALRIGGRSTSIDRLPMQVPQPDIDVRDCGSVRVDDHAAHAGLGHFVSRTHHQGAQHSSPQSPSEN
jgi:hypothetical protein